MLAKKWMNWPSPVSLASPVRAGALGLSARLRKQMLRGQQIQGWQHFSSRVQHREKGGAEAARLSLSEAVTWKQAHDSSLAQKNKPPT